MNTSRDPCAVTRSMRPSPLKSPGAKPFGEPVSAIKKGNRQAMIRWMIPTIILGVLFLSGQAYEYTRLGFLPTNGVFAAVFFTLTGFHGAHVTAGVIWLLTLLAIDYRRGLGPKDALNVDLAALYWHFVDVVWIVIFTLVYLIK